jgi:hypothetical protein
MTKIIDGPQEGSKISLQMHMGTKTIHAAPMSKVDYCNLKGWSVPDDEDPTEIGYVVAYSDDYISWSPAKAFDESYRTNGHLTFGHATEAAKAGKRVARLGWNGSGMFAYIVPAASYPAQTGAAKAHFGENAMVPYRAYWALKTAQEDIATWTPSGSDTLAEDWIILD